MYYFLRYYFFCQRLATSLDYAILLHYNVFNLYLFRSHVFPGLLAVFVELGKKIQFHENHGLYLSLIKALSATVELLVNEKEEDPEQYHIAVEEANKNVSRVCIAIRENYRNRGNWIRYKAEDISQELKV